MVQKLSRTVARPAPPPRETGEDRRADAVTVIWMLTAVATLAAVAVAGIARLFVLAQGAAGLAPLARVLPGWFLFCGTVTGLLCLALTPVVYAVRKTKPPRSVTIVAVVIGILPLLVLVIGGYAAR